MKHLPPRPTVGDVYICTAIGLGFIVDRVEWNRELRDVGVTLRATRNDDGRRLTIKLCDFNKEFEVML